MSETHRDSRLRLASNSLLSRALIATAVLGTVAGLSLAGTSSALAADGGDGYNGVFLSEVYPHGADTPDNVVTQGDWIELYNSSSDPVDLGGVILSDDDNSNELTIPNGTTIGAGDFMAFRTDSEAAGDSGFSLGDQDEARLFGPNTTNLANATPADEFDWSHSPVHSWARDFDDFSGDAIDAPWSASTKETPSLDNVVGQPAGTNPLTGIKINEVNMNGGTHGDWIELYDDAPSGSNAVNLSGAILSDSDDTHAYIIGDHASDTTTISPGGFATYEVDDSADDGNFGLGNSDAARLFRANTIDLFGNTTGPNASAPVGGGAATLDSVSWNSAPQNTLARIPDGSGGLNTNDAFDDTAAPTFDTSNDDATGPTYTFHDLTGVVINEVKTTGDPQHGDWVELLNTTASQINLSDAILSDNNNSHVIRIANGVNIEPHQTVTVTTDTDTDGLAPVFTDPNVGSGDFGLGDDDEVRLYDDTATTLGTILDPAPNSPIDSFSWTNHAATSYGRKAGEDVTNTESSTVWGQTTNPTYDNPSNDFTNPTDYTVNGTDNSGLNYIQLNEIESTDNTGDPFPNNDWVELINTAPVSINVNGMILSDSEDSHTITLNNLDTETGHTCTPGTWGTTIPAGQFALVKVDDSSIAGNFGLGSNDAVRLYAPNAIPGTTIPIDHYEWTDHPAGSYQRTDNGLGDWINGAAGTQTPLGPNTGCL